MSNPRLLQDKFDGGFKRDMSPDQIPKNALYDVEDFLPDLDAPLRKRGGWAYQGNALDTVDAAATVPKIVAWAPFTSTAGQLIAFDNNGKVLDMTNNADRGDHTTPLHTPVFFRDLLLWADGSNPAKKYDGATVASIGGSPPATPRCALVWNERLVLSGANSTPASAATIYFSAAGNAESWDTTNAFVRTNQPIVGLAALPNAMIVFHSGSVTKILGDTPPSATSIGTPLTVKTLFNNVGLYEPNAFAVQDEHVFWADENGVYKSDGTSLTDLTARGGIRTYWQDLIDTPGVDAVAVGVWRGYVWVAVSGSDSELAFLLCDIEKKAWWKFGNIVARNFSVRPGATDDMYFSNRQTKFVGKLSTVFLPTSTVKNDADGEVVNPFFITGYFRVSGQGQKRLRHIYLGHDIRDAASDNPTLAVSYAAVPGGSFTGTTPSSLSETTEYKRKRVRAGKALNGAAIQVQQASASSDTKIYAIEADIAAREGSRR